MATTVLGPFKVSKTFSGAQPFRQAIAEADTGTFKKGAVLVRSTAGKFAEAGSDPVGIMGVADEDGHNLTSGTEADKIHYNVADPNTLFTGNLISTSTGTPTSRLDIGESYGITKVGTNWHVDKAKRTNTNRRVIVIDLDPRDAIGDTGGRVLFQFVQQFTGVSYTS